MPEQISLRLKDGTRERLQEIADAEGRTKSFIIQEAIDRYLEEEAWQIEAIKEGLEAVERGDVIPFEEIKREFGIK